MLFYVKSNIQKKVSYLWFAITDISPLEEE